MKSDFKSEFYSADEAEEENCNNCNLLEKKHTVLEKKYKNLVAKLRDRIECPVCFEVPESGPVFSCPNGHLVCSNCKADSCPSCRTKMFNNKSMLAVTALENIEHQCTVEGCDAEVLFGKVKYHKEKCVRRIINCPATECEEEMELFSFK